MKLLFIGGGNMASSIIGGLIADGYNANDIGVVEIDSDKRQRLQQNFSVNVFNDVSTVDQHTDVILFCTKPQQFKTVAIETGKMLHGSRPLIISIAAGIRTRDIALWLGGQYAIVRAMSNTPALVQSGACALFATSNVSDIQRDQAESLMRATGIVEWISEEDLMDVVTALSGSGPAYFFRIMEGLVKGAEQLGLSKQVAHLLTIQTALGAAKMALESNDDIATLREKVTSPGGTTERGLAVMTENNIDDLILKILEAAKNRATQLADQLGEQ